MSKKDEKNKVELKGIVFNIKGRELSFSMSEVQELKTVLDQLLGGQHVHHHYDKWWYGVTTNNQPAVGIQLADRPFTTSTVICTNNVRIGAESAIGDFDIQEGRPCVTDGVDLSNYEPQRSGTPANFALPQPQQAFDATTGFLQVSL